MVSRFAFSNILTFTLCNRSDEYDFSIEAEAPSFLVLSIIH